MIVQKIEFAIILIKAGELKQGGQLLIEIIEREPNNDLAWIWLTACYRNPKYKTKCMSKLKELVPKSDNSLEAVFAIQDLFVTMSKQTSNSRGKPHKSVFLDDLENETSKFWKAPPFPRIKDNL